MSDSEQVREEVLIGSLVSITGSAMERDAAGRVLIQYEKDGEIVREWFLAEELSPLGFDDGDGI